MLDEQIKKRVLDIFALQLRDNVKARVMQPDGIYRRAERGDTAVDAQAIQFAESYANAPLPERKTAEPPKKKGFFARLKALFSKKS